MSASILDKETPEFLSRVREIVRHAHSQGIVLTTTTGDLVTLQNLPRLVHRGEAIEMVSEDGELIAVTLPDGERPDTLRPREGLPAFSQLKTNGERTNFWPLPAGHWRSNKSDYRPTALLLDAHILNPHYDPFGRLMRVEDIRVPGRFRSLEVKKA